VIFGLPVTGSSPGVAPSARWDRETRELEPRKPEQVRLQLAGLDTADSLKRGSTK
jgi:hypothetical protein